MYPAQYAPFYKMMHWANKPVSYPWLSHVTLKAAGATPFDPGGEEN